MLIINWRYVSLLSYIYESFFIQKSHVQQRLPLEYKIGVSNSQIYIYSDVIKSIIIKVQNQSKEFFRIALLWRYYLNDRIKMI